MNGNLILAVDIGNTTVAFAIFSDTNNNPLFVERMESSNNIKLLEYSKGIEKLLNKHNINPVNIKNSIMSSVVPALTKTLCNAITKVIGISTFVVNTQTNNFIKIEDYDSTTLGSDRIVDAISAILQYKPPLIVIDLGTATTFSVINSDGSFVGGIIMPGPKLFIEALSTRTAQLPNIDIKESKLTSIIGHNTTECLLNGTVIGTAAAIDGIISRIENELGTSVTVVATGGHCKYIIPWCNNHIKYDEHLLLKGLYYIYHNHKKTII